MFLLRVVLHIRLNEWLRVESQPLRVFAEEGSGIDGSGEGIGRSVSFQRFQVPGCDAGACGGLIQLDPSLKPGPPEPRSDATFLGRRDSHMTPVRRPPPIGL